MQQVKYFSSGAGTFQEFLEHCFLKNEPCLLGDWATEGWGSRVQWVHPSDDTLNFKYLLQEFGNAKVSVADCNQWEFSTHVKKEMTLSEYLDYWRSPDDRLLYLKDWHFTKDFPSKTDSTYKIPLFFCSDWLNEVWAVREDVDDDDYRFVYMGPKGTWTPFHADVFRSFSWSANISGKKEWFLYPPGKEDNLRDNLGNLPCDITRDKETLYVIQKAGEIIFVPSGWHHQVRNMKSTISFNHNWCNSFCLDDMWKHLQSELILVQQELEDCKTMENWAWQCQILLKASAGMDYWEFAQFLVIIASPRVSQFELLCDENSHLPSTVSPDTYSSQLKHFIQEIKDIKYTKHFFKNGVFPLDLDSRPIPDCLGLCLNEREKLDVLLSELPQELRDKVSCRQNNHLVFRAFEIYKLSSVSQELISVLPQ